MKIHNSLICSIAIVFTFFLFLLGCTSLGPTRPNIPFKGTYPKNFKHIEANNSLLAREIGKLPEFQDGISVTNERALNIIISLYKEIPIEFDAAFNQMYQTGKPEYRRFCTPLQALFWIAEAGKQVQNLKELIVNYSLINLLEKSWFFKKRIWLASDEVAAVIAEVMDPLRKSDYKGLHIERGDKFLCMILEINYRRNPEFFTKKGREILRSALKNAESYGLKNEIRWGNYNKVVERLNAPELIEYYFDNTFRYKKTSMPQSANTTFVRKIGDCKAYAIFAYTCLDKSGYDTFIYTMDPTAMSGHTICVYKLFDSYFSLDNIYRGICGPFKNFRRD